MIFILLVFFLPLQYAIWSAIIIGMMLLCLLSYFIALYHNASPFWEIVEHLSVAVVVLVASDFLGQIIHRLFGV